MDNCAVFFKKYHDPDPGLQTLLIFAQWHKPDLIKTTLVYSLVVHGWERRWSSWENINKENGHEIQDRKENAYRETYVKWNASKCKKCWKASLWENHNPYDGFKWLLRCFMFIAFKQFLRRILFPQSKHYLLVNRKLYKFDPCLFFTFVVENCICGISQVECLDLLQKDCFGNSKM